MVVRQKVAVLTSDAQADERFEAGMSIRMQQIRSAMCAPLWNRDSVIGVIHVDSPLHVGTFTEKDLDLLTALSNFAAVAIERARLHERVEEDKRIRGRLERYHSPQVIEEIIAGRDSGGSLKQARTKTVTILFADLVGFTTWSEKMAAEDLAALLTKFFTLASDAVFSREGTIDKFIGDAVMAFFGAPIDQPDHAARAVSTALKIRSGVDEWNQESEKKGEAPDRGSDRPEHRRGDRRGDRLREPGGLHGSRQRGERRGANGGIRRVGGRHLHRPGHLRIGQVPVPLCADGPLRPEGTLDAGPDVQGHRRAVAGREPGSRLRQEEKGVRRAGRREVRGSKF